MDTISNTTCTKCQHCGKWTNYADDAHHKARDARIAELEAELEQSCEHCGARVYSGPPDCPRCAAPQCCPQCCKIDTLSRRITELEAERDRLRKTLSWSFIRTLLSQGMSIQQDYDAGKYKDYEEVSARLDAAARERCAMLEGE